MNDLVCPHIVFRADASIQIGTGHIMRCLTLADALREQGARCTFICRPHSGHLLSAVSERGHCAVALPSLASEVCHLSGATAHAAWLGTNWQTDAQETRDAIASEVVDWLVVDHYALDRRWENTLRPHCQRLMVIDDLADRPHDCDVLLDQNLGRTIKDYGGLISPRTATFFGPQYALLRPEFAQLRHHGLARRAQPQLKRLLITMGGVDKDNATGQVLQALSGCSLPKDLSITVVMGLHAPCLVAVKAQAAQMPWLTQVLVGVGDMAQLMADCDLCIGAAGGTSWERCCLGLPTLLLVLASNQQISANALKQIQAVRTLDISDLEASLNLEMQTLTDKSMLTALSSAAQVITSGFGAPLLAAAMMSAHLGQSPVAQTVPRKDCQ